MSNALFHSAVYIIIRDEAGKILLHQRAGTSYLPGYWDFPSGHVEDDESFAAAAVRELREETSLTVTEADLELMQVSINYTDRPYVNLVFAANKWTGTPTITEPHKCTGMEFFAEDALPDKLTLGVRNMQNNQFKKNLSASLFVDRAKFNEIMGEEIMQP